MATNSTARQAVQINQRNEHKKKGLFAKQQMDAEATLPLSESIFSQGREGLNRWTVLHSLYRHETDFALAKSELLEVSLFVSV
jgi:hypothetical protein